MAGGSVDRTKRGQRRRSRPTSVMNTRAKEAGIPRASHSASGFARMCCSVGLMPGRCTPSCCSEGLFMPAREKFTFRPGRGCRPGFVRACKRGVTGLRPLGDGCWKNRRI